MFLAGLNEQQKKAFLALAIKLIGSDGRLDPAERNLIEQMRMEMGLLQETDLPQGSIEELAELFDTRRSQSIVLMECIALAYADQELSGEEEKILRALALIFEISEENATEMENWVLNFKKLQKRAEEILEK